MERLRKCKTCGKNLDYFEGHTVPIHIPASPGFPMPSGGVELFCDKCYKDYIGQSFSEDQERINEEKSKILSRIKEFHNQHKEIQLIKNLQIFNAAIIVGICSYRETKEFKKINRTLKMVSCTIQDETGEISIILWNEDCDKIKIGNPYKITGYCKEYNGNKQITIGYNSKIEELEL